MVNVKYFFMTSLDIILCHINFIKHIFNIFSSIKDLLQYLYLFFHEGEK